MGSVNGRKEHQYEKTFGGYEWNGRKKSQFETREGNGGLPEGCGVTGRVPRESLGDWRTPEGSGGLEEPRRRSGGRSGRDYLGHTSVLRGGSHPRGGDSSDLHTA